MKLDWWPTTPESGWEWTPALYVGALLAAFTPLVVVLLVARRRRVLLRRRSRWLLAAGTATLLVAISWPLADLAQVMLAGRAVQYLLLTLAAPPLLLLGIPRWRASSRGLVRAAAERLAGAPWVGALLLALTAFTTHTRGVVDGLEGEPVGQAAVRGLWFTAALIYWWPLVGPGPERERLPYLAGLAYLILPFAFPKAPAAVWVFAQDPLYERFQDAAGPWGISAGADQGMAGFILWFPGSVMVATAAYLLIRHWMQEDRRLGLRERLGVPADPTALSALMANPDAPELWRVLEALVRIVDDAAPPRQGSDLDFAVEGSRVILQLHVPEREDDDQEVLVRKIEAGYAAHLRQYPEPRAEVIRRYLAVEVLTYGARVR